MLKWIVSVVLTIVLVGTAHAQGSDYKIKAGDRLSIEVLEDASLNRTILVLPDGSISVPLAGTVRASGLTVAQLQAKLTSSLAPNFASTPSVFVSIQAVAQRAAAPSRRTIEVFLIGEVSNPSSHQVPRGTTVLQFLAQSGGFTKFAAKKRLQLRRTTSDGAQKNYRINYKAIEEGGDVSTAMAQLQNGDVIVVPERKLFE